MAHHQGEWVKVHERLVSVAQMVFSIVCKGICLLQALSVKNRTRTGWQDTIKSDFMYQGQVSETGVFSALSPCLFFILRSHKFWHVCISFVYVLCMQSEHNSAFDRWPQTLHRKICQTLNWNCSLYQNYQVLQPEQSIFSEVAKKETCLKGYNFVFSESYNPQHSFTL